MYSLAATPLRRFGQKRLFEKKKKKKSAGRAPGDVPIGIGFVWRLLPMIPSVKLPAKRRSSALVVVIVFFRFRMEKELGL